MKEREERKREKRREVEGRGESGVPPSVAKEDRRVRVADKRVGVRLIAALESGALVSDR